MNKSVENCILLLFVLVDVTIKELQGDAWISKNAKTSSDPNHILFRVCLDGVFVEGNVFLRGFQLL